MKTALIILLTISLIGIAVFGFFGMSHASADSHQSGCIAATADGIECPMTFEPLEMVSFHVGVFKAFSNAIFSKNFLTELLLLASFLSLVWLISSRDVFFSLLRFDFRKRNNFLELFFPLFKIELLSWLSLHENSPAIL